MGGALAHNPSGWRELTGSQRRDDSITRIYKQAGEHRHSRCRSGNRWISVMAMFQQFGIVKSLSICLWQP